MPRCTAFPFPRLEVWLKQRTCWKPRATVSVLSVDPSLTTMISFSKPSFPTSAARTRSSSLPMRAPSLYAGMMMESTGTANSLSLVAQPISNQRQKRLDSVPCANLLSGGPGSRSIIHGKLQHVLPLPRELGDDLRLQVEPVGFEVQRA